MVLYESTRGGNEKITSAEAIKRGIAPDGGLYVPCKFHKLNLKEIKDLVDMTYPERAVAILRHFLDDFSEEELIDCVNSAYSHKFTHVKVAPVVELNESLFLLELWHGPTCAFKDMALQILPHLLVKSMKKTGEKSKVIILTATSGDTGKAALEGFADVEGTGIIVFYPDNGVSEIQKYQMITQTGENVKVFGVRGNFDDTQTGVKRIFTDKELISFMEARNLKFSSANSINWGRLAPQIVYYFSAYADLIKENRIAAGDKINFVVPTGNFGNILAGFYAAKMGLPVNRLVCASNDNNILTDFIRTGCYDKRREFIKTVSPSMDILISSNLERLLYEVTNHDGKKVSQWMNELYVSGSYDIGQKNAKEIKKYFWAGWSNQDETLKTIECVYSDYKYVLDTHTAVAVDVYDKYVITTGDLTPSVVISTASPFKFNNSVCKALFGENKIADKSEFELLELLSKECDLPIPAGLAGLDKKEVLHKSVCDKEGMKDAVIQNLLEEE
ncbi:MAG: threonine synthase [Clostridiaceae bacterium]|jgi:threonine synthase|nr:threonine synthase [Clostridiaceae bacterium]